MTKQELGSYLAHLSKTRWPQLASLRDAAPTDCPISKRAFFNLKTGKFSEHTAKVLADSLGVEVETSYIIKG